MLNVFFKTASCACLKQNRKLQNRSHHLLGSRPEIHQLQLLLCSNKQQAADVTQFSSKGKVASSNINKFTLFIHIDFIHYQYGTLSLILFFSPKQVFCAIFSQLHVGYNLFKTSYLKGESKTLWNGFGKLTSFVSLVGYHWGFCLVRRAVFSLVTETHIRDTRSACPSAELLLPVGES